MGFICGQSKLPCQISLKCVHGNDLGLLSNKYNSERGFGYGSWREMVNFGEEDCVKIMQFPHNSFGSNEFQKQTFSSISKAVATLVIGYRTSDLLWTWKYAPYVEVVFGLVRFLDLEPRFVLSQLIRVQLVLLDRGSNQQNL